MAAYRLAFLILILCICLQPALAQQFGGNPPSLQWRQINTDTVRVIFPTGLERQARDVSQIVHRLAAESGATIGNRVRKVNIVLQNQTTQSNGYAALAPFRSEFFLTPRQNSFELGSLPWHKTLALHEYRHVQQFNNFRKGISKLFYLLFGEAGQSLANSTAVPDWFWEGDAVYQETLFSDQGRGALPYFHNDFRSLWAAGKNYSWMKLRNGSLRDFTPDHYRLGYLMTAYGRRRYGDTIWKKVTNDAVRFKGLFYPFQKAVKRHTGISYRQFRSDAFHYFQQAAPVDTQDAPAQYAARQQHFAGDEEFPQWTAGDSLVLVKSSFRELPAFYIRDAKSGMETKWRNRDISLDNYFSYRNNRIVYSSFRPHPRWGWKNYSLITIADLHSGTERTITSRTRYFSPDLSPDGNTVVAVYVDANGDQALHLLDAGTGRLLKKIPNPSSHVYTYPKFDESAGIVSAVRNKKGEMALLRIDPATGGSQVLVPFAMRVIGFPQVNGDTISFTMSNGRQDNLYGYANGPLLQFMPDAENHSTGNYQLSTRDGHYAWTSFTAAGQKLYTGAGHWAAADAPGGERLPIYPPPTSSKGMDLISLADTRNDSIAKYASSFRLLNFHSWRPYISDPEYSYSLTSENILNTLQSELFVTYNRNEGFTQGGAALAYAGWFPVLKGAASYTFSRSFLDSTGLTTWNEFNANASAGLPLRFVNGTFRQNLNINTGFNTQQVYYTGASKQRFGTKRFNYADLSVSATNQQAVTVQQIYPRFAQTMLVRYRSILNNYTANQLLLSGALYLPGFSRTHSLVLQAAFQRRDTLQQYTFSNGFPMSRGYEDINFPRMWRLGITYHFPIFYPDAGFAQIVYLLRVRANVFYDYSRAKSLRTGLQLPFQSAGCEMYVDSQWWNQLPVSIGIRYSRLLNTSLTGLGANQFEIVLPVTLLSR